MIDFLQSIATPQALTTLAVIVLALSVLNFLRKQIKINTLIVERLKEQYELNLELQGNINWLNEKVRHLENGTKP